MTRDEGGQHSAVLRQVTAGVVVKLTVLHDYVGFCVREVGYIAPREVPGLDAVGVVDYVGCHSRFTTSHKCICYCSVDGRLNRVIGPVNCVV